MIVPRYRSVALKYFGLKTPFPVLNIVEFLKELSFVCVISINIYHIQN